MKKKRRKIGQEAREGVRNCWGGRGRKGEGHLGIGVRSSRMKSHLQGWGKGKGKEEGREGEGRAGDGGIL